MYAADSLSSAEASFVAAVGCLRGLGRGKKKALGDNGKEREEERHASTYFPIYPERAYVSLYVYYGNWESLRKR